MDIDSLNQITINTISFVLPLSEPEGLSINY